jgi:repressor LexA
MVVVKPVKDAMNNEIIVANVNEETTVKRLKKIGKEFVLKPENDVYPTIKEAFEIVGKVIGVIRKV